MPVRIKRSTVIATQISVTKKFEKVRRNKQMLNEIGEAVTTRVRLEARRRKPLNDTRTFPALTEGTKARRKALAKVNKTHPSFKPAKSSTTFTGQLLDAVTFKIRKTLVELFVAKSKRQAIKGARGKTLEEQIAFNNELAKELASRGFVIFTAKGLKSEPKLAKRINNIVRRTLRRALKVD